MAKTSNKILAYVKKRENFDIALENDLIKDDSIVFIEDTQQIYTHGTYFDGGGLNWQVIEASQVLKGEEKFGILQCNREDFEGLSSKSAGVLALVDYIVTAGQGALGVAPGTRLQGTHLYKGDQRIDLIMNDMILENEIQLNDKFKIVPDNFVGVIKQLFNIISGNSGGDDYWNDLDGPVTPDEPTGSGIIWGDVDKSNSAVGDEEQTWANVTQTNMAGGSPTSLWHKLFRYK